MRQTRLPIDWIVGAEQSSSDSSGPEEQVVKRGRPEHPLQWTRVQTVKHMMSAPLAVHDYKKDLQSEKQQKVLRAELEHGEGCFAFDPFKLNTELDDLSTATNRLSDGELLRYAKLATELRVSFTQKASALAGKPHPDTGAGSEAMSFQMPKLHRGCKRAKRASVREDLKLGFEGHTIRAAGRKRRRSSLAHDELRGLARAVLEEGVEPEAAALESNVKLTMVRQLVQQVRKDDSSVETIRAKQTAREEKHAEAAAIVKRKLEAGHQIWTAKQVQDSLRAEAGLALSLQEVRKVLRDNMNMRYRMLKTVEYRGNSERCLVTRMLYAKTMLELLHQGKRIINIDETWLPHLDFRRKKWRQRGERNTASLRQLSHRVNMIAALDTDGNLYMSLTQTNTDSDCMMVFMSHLCTVLSAEQSDWRDDTYWLLDNATYHRSQEVREHLRLLGVKVVLSGQYAYSAAPIELFFSYYKREDQNPERLATGKT